MSLEDKIEELSEKVDALTSAMAQAASVWQQRTGEASPPKETAAQKKKRLASAKAAEEENSDENPEAISADDLQGMAKNLIRDKKATRAALKKLIKQVGGDAIGDLDDEQRMQLASEMSKLADGGGDDDNDG
jgi:hypothetical protein